MAVPEKNKQKRTYEKANSVLTWMFLPLLAGNFLIQDKSERAAAVYLTIVALIFSMVSGYVAYLHSKLPKQEKERVRWLTLSCFSMHPYITFAIFILMSIIGILGLLTT